MNKIKELLCVSEEEIQAVRRMYNKTECDIEEDMNLLLDWFKKQPHLPKHIDKARLERFLLRNKFRIEQTKIKLDNYYSLQIFYSHFYEFMKLDDSQLMQNLRKSVVVTPMPKLLPTLQRLFFFDVIENEADNFYILDLMRYVLMYWEFQLSYDYCSSDLFVCNAKYFSFKHVVKYDPNTIHKWFVILKNGYSARLFQVHFVIASPATDALMHLLKRVLSVKLFEKIIIHKNFDSLHKVVPKEYLPEEAEGTAGSAKDNRDKWIEEMALQREFLKTRAEETSNEILRIGKSNYSDLFGVDGTFRKINLD